MLHVCIHVMSLHPQLMGSFTEQATLLTTGLYLPLSHLLSDQQGVYEDTHVHTYRHVPY